MSKGRRVKRSGWKHAVNINRTRRRWARMLRGASGSIERRVWIRDARLADAEQDLRDHRLM